MAFEPVRRRKRTAVSFAGCGFMGMYHVGIGLAIQELAPEEIDTFQMFYGASAGAIVAVFGACNLSAKEGYKFIKGLHDKAHGKWLGRLGALHPSFNLMDEVRSYLERILPKDAHRKCSKRVGISLTIFPDYKNWIVSDFNTRSELIQVLDRILPHHEYSCIRQLSVVATFLFTVVLIFHYLEGR
jgi:predicted acylesterase/phospholipase RssA